MRYIFILLFFSKVLFCQTNKSLIIKGFEGITYYPDSTIKSAYHLKNNKPAGYSIEFNEKGEAVYIGKYFKGTKHGWWIKPNDSCDYYIEGVKNVPNMTTSCQTSQPINFDAYYTNIINKTGCNEKLDSINKYIFSEWKFTGAVFYSSQGEKQNKSYPEHFLSLSKKTFSVKTSEQAAFHQSGKVKLETLNSSNSLNCEAELWFSSKGELPDDIMGSLYYNDLWTIHQCTKDSLVLWSPWNCEFITAEGTKKDCGMLEKTFIRK